MEFFKSVKNLEELKLEYKRLCKIHHPDLGGDTATMQLINAEYAKMLISIDLGKSTVEVESAIMDIIQATVVYNGLIVELCGNWVWFTGATRQWKDQLKALGCFFSSKKAAWYWRPAEYKHKGKSMQSLDQVRQKYGSKVFAGQEREVIA
jgi:hypothetical protein